MKSKINKESRMRPEPPVAETESQVGQEEEGGSESWVHAGGVGGGTVGGVDPGGTDRKWSLSHRL